MISYEEKFAFNIHRLRQKAGFTQKQLAEKLVCSEKTVSKWECGAAIPTIDVLYRIAGIFRVGLEELFQEDHIYFLGIDGGGTKTAFVLENDQGTIRKELQLVCCNPMDIGLEKAKEVLREGIMEICAGISLGKVVMYAGIAGGTSGNMRQKLADFFKEFGFLAFENDSDNQNIVAAGLQGGNGVTLIMGTGSCGIAQWNGTQKRVSGWGYLFDDGGSAYNIGREGLAAHFRYLDGTGAYTLFSDWIREEYPDAQRLLGCAYEKGKRFIAGFAGKVFACAQKGDEISLGIIRRNMEFAACIIETAAQHVKEETVKVVLAGGLSANEMAIDLLRELLPEKGNYQMQVLAVAPVEGALMLAKKLWEQNEMMGEKNIC